MKRNVTRILSMFLAVLTLAYAFPLSVFASDGQSVKAETTVGENEAVLLDESALEADAHEELSLEKQGITEAVERREESAKHFRMPDGSYTLVSYDTPVHYRDSAGEWQDIDNRLAEDSSNYVSGDARVKFAKKLTGNEVIFTLQEGNRKLALSLEGARKKTVGQVKNHESATQDGLTELQKKATLGNLSSSILYSNVLDGVDLEYLLHAHTVKENIIVKEKKESYRYTFNLSLNGLTASLQSDGSVILQDEKDGEAVYVMPAPVVFDAEGAHAPEDAAYFTLTALGNKEYALTVTVDEAWMNDASRAFPVTVDPTIGTVEASSMTDTYVYEYSPTSNYANEEYMRAGSNKYGDQFVSYWKMNTLPALPQNAYIVSASLSLYYSYYRDRSSDQTVKHKIMMLAPVTSAWPSTMTWNNRASYDSANPVAFEDHKEEGINHRLSFDITSLAREWYDGTRVNYGIAIYEQSNEFAFTQYLTSEYVNGHPRFVVNYRDLKGLEPYMSYQTHDVGYAGTGAVNYATGSLIFSIGTLTGTDALMPFTPTLVYDSAMAGKEYEYPYAQVSYSGTHTPIGFKLNTNETLAKLTMANATGSSTASYYIYADADGTEHYFAGIAGQSGFYADEDGLGLTLYEVSTSEVTITDAAGSVRRFAKLSSVPSGSGYTSGWYLSEIEDVYGNKMAITYDSGKKPTAISTVPNGIAAIEQMKIIYLDYKPAVIWNQTSGHAVILRYSATPTGALSTDREYLRELVYAHSTSATQAEWEAFSQDASQSTGISVYATAAYTYDASGRLTSAKDEKTGYEVRYTYTGGKVTEIKQYFGSSAGKTLGITYQNGITVVRGNLGINSYGSSSDVKTHYVLDADGRAVSTYTTNVAGDTVYGAQSGEYSEDALSKNSLETSVSVGGDNVSYLYNGGFKNNAQGWTATANVSFTASNELSGTDEASFLIKANTTDSLTQSVFLKSGTYTLTVNYDPHYTQNATMRLKAVSSSSSNSFSVEVPLNDNYASSGKSEYSLTFDADSITNGGEYFNISVSVTGGTSVLSGAIVYVDSLVLARGIGAEGYNIVQFGSFENHARNSNGTDYKTPAGIWTLGSYGTITTDSLFGNVARIAGSASNKREISQTVYTGPTGTLSAGEIQSLYAPKNFIVSAFGRADCSARREDSFFGIVVDVYYEPDNNPNTLDTVPHEFPFCEGVDGWQFVSGTFTTEERRILKIVVRCVYNYYLTYGYFDNVSLVCDSEGKVTHNTYKNGLLTKTTDGLFNTTHYEYNAQKQVTRVANDRGQLTDYVYDDSGYICKKEIVCTFTYTVGNSTVTTYPDTVDDSRLNITLKNVTVYTYNAYGLVTQKKYGKAAYVAVGSSSVGVSGSAIITKTSYKTTAGSPIFGYVLSETDDLGNMTRYTYDASTGSLTAVAYPGGSGVMYTYDTWGNVKSVQADPCTSCSSFTATEQTDGETVVEYTYNSKGLLESISTQSTSYSFAYGSNLLLLRLNVAGNKRNGYTYLNQKQIYEDLPNSGKLYFMYDVLGRVSKICLIESSGAETVTSDLYRYTYTDDGLLHRVEDVKDGQTTQYLYSTDGKLLGTHVSDSASGKILYGTNFLYDSQGRVSSVDNGYDYTSSSGATSGRVGYVYLYDSLDRLSTYSISTPDLTDSSRTYRYDDLRRVERISSTYTGDTKTFTQSESFGYMDSSAAASASGRVKTHTTTTGITAEKTYTYTYDSKGNITKIVQKVGTNEKQTRYVYDDQGQLIREDNALKSETYVYAYDRAGNLTSKKTYAYTAEGTEPSSPKSTNSYTYGNAWGDQLTAFNGHSITYDTVGNPLTYYNGLGSYTFTWEEGKYLSKAVRGSSTVTYTYNESGIRTSKTVNGVKHTYTLNGTQVVSEAWGNQLVLFIYDESGAPIGMQYRKSTYAEGEFDCFFYEKNLQGDIIGIFNEAGTRVVTYCYDAYGIPLATYVSGYEWVKNANPMLYRGYYYDRDMQIYYLNSRYYDSRTGRFISADTSDVLSATPMALTDKNLYAYCDNNPVMRKDGDGEFWNYIIGGAVGAVVGGVVAIANGEDLTGVIISSLAGAASGVVAASGLGLLAQAGISAGISASADVANQTADILQNGGTVADYNITQTIVESSLGFLTSAVGTKTGNAIDTKVTKNFVRSKEFFGRYTEKMATAGARQSIGKSSSALVRQANKHLKQSNFYLNAYRGASSAIGSMLSLWNILR